MQRPDHLSFKHHFNIYFNYLQDDSSIAGRGPSCSVGKELKTSGTTKRGTTGTTNSPVANSYWPTRRATAKGDFLGDWIKAASVRLDTSATRRFVIGTRGTPGRCGPHGERERVRTHTRSIASKAGRSGAIQMSLKLSSYKYIQIDPCWCFHMTYMKTTSLSTPVMGWRDLLATMDHLGYNIYLELRSTTKNQSLWRIWRNDQKMSKFGRQAVMTKKTGQLMSMGIYILKYIYVPSPVLLTLDRAPVADCLFALV